MTRPSISTVCRRAAAVAVLLLAVAPGLACAAEPSDPKATAIADKVMAQLGGKKKWDQLRGLKWTFGAEVRDTVRGTPRRHTWDKYTGWHRVQGKNRQGQDFVVVHSLKDSTGAAWVAGQKIEGDSLRTLIRFAYSTWINDTYWMLMPYKLRDPGVMLKYDGRATVDGHEYDKLALSFDQVGETPGDHYWVYVNPRTMRVERWDMVLQDAQPPPRSYTWEGWEQKGGLWFPTAHRNTDHVNVFTRDVETVAEFGPKEFTSL
jgi:hypothetical protein